MRGAAMRRAASAALFGLLAAGAADKTDPEYAQWSARASDDDLFTYVTRPDLRPSKFNIALKKKDRTAPGYIFVAPYDCLECAHVPVTTYSPQQIGPHIYTEDGELVWSGGDLLPGTKVFDFQSLEINGQHHLSLIAPPGRSWESYPDGVAMVLNASYHPVFTIDGRELGSNGQRVDMHEFRVLNESRTALIAMTHRRAPRAEDNVEWKGDILDCTFTEYDLLTQQRTFNWTASEHVPLTESSNPPPTGETRDEAWEWFQLNSIDKDKFGNYLVSARATNTIYYVSSTGSIIWRLGSSFTQNFNFSRQHHVRVRNQNKVDMVISFFDNAADETNTWKPTSSSSGLKVAGLDLENMNARLYHVHERRDGGLTSTSTGSVQFLPNGGVFGGWGENGYMTEYVNRGGPILYEASFASKRFTNYRAYKMEFVAQPSTKPLIKGFVSTNSRAQPTTNLYVSWNGATEVAKWRFYSHGPSNEDTEIGKVARTGFETTFTAMGYHPIIFVEALDESGTSLANSSLEVTEIPRGFHDVSNPMYTNANPDSRLTASFASPTAVAFIAGMAVAVVWERFRVRKHNLPRKPGPPRWAGLSSLRWGQKRNA